MISSKADISKSILRHKSRQRLFAQKRNSSSTQNISATELRKDGVLMNASQSNLVKLKRPPLSNLSLMRSQSNISLCNRDKNSKVLKLPKSKISSFKSPDLTHKCHKLSDMKSEGYSGLNRANEMTYSTRQLPSSNLMQMQTTTNKDIQLSGHHTSISAPYATADSAVTQKCRN
jgi:hypothetical protein